MTRNTNVRTERGVTNIETFAMMKQCFEVTESVN
jgi:hypothetical protein